MKFGRVRVLEQFFEADQQHFSSTCEKEFGNDELVRVFDFSTLNLGGNFLWGLSHVSY